jgi:glycosyltransferase involved in cell wall biosynthesis
MAKIVFWLGPALERWDFATALDTGIGGSETAAIHLARELVKLGHEVDVYGDFAEGRAWSVLDKVIVMGGLRMTSRDVLCAIPYHEWISGQPCDLFVSSRQPGARRHCLPQCKKAWLWVHDLHCGPDWDNQIGIDYDRVLCLSDFAREQFLLYYPSVDQTKVVKTSNAVDLALFQFHQGPELAFTKPSSEPEHPENTMRVGVVSTRLVPGLQHVAYRDGFSPLRVTYSSSPDRGLDKLLDLWPKICKLVALPEGFEGLRSEGLRPELHVYYGFDNWRKAAELSGSEVDLFRIDHFIARLAETPGVCYHGRAGQAEVARSYLRSQLWLFPTDFLETSCITAMEAQAAGCKIVATRCGALPGTTSSACPYLVDGPTSAPDYDDRFLLAVWTALSSDEVVVPAVPTWSGVAAQWDAWIREGA